MENARRELEFAIRNKDEKLISYWTERVKAREEKIKKFSEEKKKTVIEEPLKTLKEGPDLTTAEGRQKEIDRIMAAEESIEEKNNENSEGKNSNEEIREAFEKISVEQKELAEKLLTAAEKQEEKIEQEIKQEKPWIREKIEKAADWYKKQPLKYKILFSLGCVGAASASAALGGAIGAAVATAAFTGSAFQRMLGGMATFITVEGFLKRAAEKGGRERTKWEAGRHTMEAAVLGVLVGSGKFAEGMRNVVGMIMPEEVVAEIKETTENIKKSAGLSPEQISPAPKAAAPIGTEAISQEFYIETAKPGDSVWKMAQRQLEEHYGKSFVELNEAQKTYIIDAIKDRVAADPQSFGLENIDNIKVGQKIDFSEIFKKELDIEDTFSRAEELSGTQMENIVKNNEILREWVKNHPTERLTSEKVEEILHPTVKPSEPFEPSVEPSKLPPEISSKREEFSLIDEEKVKTDLNKVEQQIKAISEEYNDARLKLSEANVNSYTSDLPKEEIQTEINKYYEKSVNLENQLEELKSSKAELEEILKIQQEPKFVEQMGINLSADQIRLLDDLIYKDTSFVKIKVDKLAELIRFKKLTPEDFAQYYANKLGAEKVSNEILNNLKNNFKSIIEGSANERLKAQEAIETLLERLRR